MSWKNKANQHHGHKKVIHKPEAQAKKILNRIHEPEAQAKRVVMQKNLAYSILSVLTISDC